MVRYMRKLPESMNDVMIKQPRLQKKGGQRALLSPRGFLDPGALRQPRPPLRPCSSGQAPGVREKVPLYLRYFRAVGLFVRPIQEAAGASHEFGALQFLRKEAHDLAW